MTQEQFKSTIQHFLDNMISSWFPNNTMSENLCKAAAKTLVKSNINKYDNVLNYFTDASGTVCINDFLDYFIDSFEGYSIDLDSFDIPFLPHRIILISKDDIIALKHMCMNITQ